MRRETQRAMRKDLGFDSVSATRFLERIERHDIDVVLSFIFGFPTESDAQFVREIVQRFSNVTVIINRFSLFRDTEIERNPHEFGIAELLSPHGPFDAQRDYMDVHGRDSRNPHP
ncbi:MAG: phosphopantetheine-binding protein, partial [Methyloceanibacter sp.]